jgi:RsiW-degrading membrane proteinase PrsW (M82 family)
MLTLDLLLTAVVAAAIAPALLLLWLVVAADTRPEPPRVVWSAFALGAMSIFAIPHIRRGIEPLLTVPHDPWLAVGEYALLMVGIPEESIKTFIIALIALRVRAFDEPMDGVVYGTAVGLGFAALENLGYLTSSNDWQTVAIVRGVLTVPFHGALGAIAGAYIASYRFGGALGAHRRGHWTRARLILSAWLVPVVLHTLFDIPMLSLRRGFDHGGLTRAALRVVGLIVGFGAIALAVRLAVRIGGHQIVWPQNSRTSIATWREIWALLVIGAGVGFTGAVLMVSGVSQLSAETASAIISFGVGGTLVLLAIVTYAWANKFISKAAGARHGAEIKGKV